MRFDIWAGDRYTTLVGEEASNPDNYPGLECIAHALSQINRFTGHTSRPVSVAEHSCLVTRLAEFEPGLSPLEHAQLQLCCLAHDMGEAFTGDVSSPLKRALGDSFKQIEQTIESALWRKFGLTELMARYKEQIKKYDLQSLAIEKRDLIPRDKGQWLALQGVEPPAGVRLDAGCWPSPATWAHTFTELFYELKTLITPP